MIRLPGNELCWDPSLSKIERLYCRFLGVPIVGLRVRLRQIVKLLPRSAERILDAGCGRGVISRKLAQRYPLATVDALDHNERGQDINRHLASAMGLRNCNFIVQELEDFNAENEYDLIISVDNLEHIMKDQQILNKMFDAMKSKGILIVHVPHYYRRWPIFKWQVNFNVPGHVRCGYHQAEIVEKVCKAGFSLEETGFSYGFFENLSNNIGYLITGAEERNRILYALTFPLLNLFAWSGQCRSCDFGAGVWVVGQKKT